MKFQLFFLSYACWEYSRDNDLSKVTVEALSDTEERLLQARDDHKIVQSFVRAYAEEKATIQEEQAIDKRLEAHFQSRLARLLASGQVNEQVLDLCAKASELYLELDLKLDKELNDEQQRSNIQALAYLCLHPLPRGESAEIEEPEKYLTHALFFTLRKESFKDDGKGSRRNPFLEEGLDVLLDNLSDAGKVKLKQLLQDGDTPLHNAVQREQCDAVSLLLDRGAIVDIKTDMQGIERYLMLALIKANYLGDFSEIVKYIRSGELEVNSVLGIVVMHIARHKDNVEVVGLL